MMKKETTLNERKIRSKYKKYMITEVNVSCKKKKLH